MPIYEYHCGKCENRFEVLLRTGRQKVGCPRCKSRKVTRKFSVFGLNLGASPGKPFTGLCNCGAGGCAICSAKV